VNASIIGVVVCIIFSALFSSVETAFTSLTVFQIRSIKTRYRGGAIIERLAKKPDELIATILIGNNVVNIVASVLATRLALRVWGDWSLGLMTGVLTLVILIFGEVAPKRIAIAHNEIVAALLAPLLLVCTWLFKPAVLIVNALSSLVTRLFGKPTRAELSMETMTQMLVIAEHMGIIDYAKGAMVKNVFRLGYTTVQAIMTHRMDVFSLDKHTTALEACRQAAESGHSRFPVYEGDSEKIVGVVTLRSAFLEVMDGRGQTILADLMVEPLYMLPSKPLGDLFMLFKSRKDTFAIVLDEYGGLAGLVTMRDLVEEIVGEIYEDTDEMSRERMRRRPDGSFAVSGDAPLSLLAEYSGAEPPSLPYVQTVAGYIAWYLDRIPSDGDQADTPLGRFIVVRTGANRVEDAIFHPPDKVR
jgi:CBS domain containing-hemolysin-like protein